MIEKMKFLSITGPEKDIDRVVETYLSRYEFQLENALSELKTVKDLRPFMENNPYKAVLDKAQSLAGEYHGLLEEAEGRQDAAGRKMGIEDAAEVISRLESQLEELAARRDGLIRQQEELQTSRDRVVSFIGLNYNIKEILRFRFIKFRFGRISKEYYEKFSSYVYDTIDTVMFKCREEGDYVWLVYFVPDSLSEKIDAIYASMHFERCFLPDEYEGTPMEAGHVLESKIEELQKAIDQAQKDIVAALGDQKEDFAAAWNTLKDFSANFDVRKMAALTKHDSHNFYILCGWMPQGQAEQFQKEIEKDSDVFCIVEDDHSNIMSKPPTKMRNPKLFKPFEMYVEMYGLPAYNELDPTILIGITYSVLFGFMFGDAGQGLCLLIGGFLLYRLKKIRLAGIISCCGLFSTVFGFLFGSIFGFENIIEPLWLRPQEAMTDLPFIGKLNTVFVVAVAIGMGIILLCMVLNMINSFRSHDTEKLYFDTNGAAGLVFYFALASVIVLYMTGRALPATIVLAVMFVIPLLLIFFKEPLTAAVEKKGGHLEGGLGMFITQGVFELFEVLLSYFSNTLSFVRVGAFAVSHAAMMQVVLMLAGAEAGGNTNWAVVIGGNLFVCAMEGLIVGIQVLRLEYYELFSRFYRGSGRAFEPYGKAAGEQ